MTLAGFAREWIRTRYAKARYTHVPDRLRLRNLRISNNNKPAKQPRRFYGIEDMMLTLHSKPAEVRTVRHLKCWIRDYVVDVMNNERGESVPLGRFIMAFDRWTPNVKGIVCHTERDKGVEPLPMDAGQVYMSDDHPDMAIPNGEDWVRFLKTREAVRRQLFPIIYNTFIDPDYFLPLEGQILVMHGLPGRKEFRDEPVVGGVWGQRVTVPVLVACPTITAEMEKEKPDIYQNIYVVERFVGSEHPIRHEWEVAKNNIGEADCALVFYEKWFSAEDHSTCVVRTGDGDAFSLLLLHSYERLVAGKFHNKMYLWMPCTDAKNRQQGVTREWFDINRLFKCIRDDVDLGTAGVQNPIVSFVFMIVLSGTDFFCGPSKNYLHDVGAEKIIWPTFLANAKQFSHMVQLLTDSPPDQHALRHIVVDVEAFRQFSHLCYVEKHRLATMKHTGKKSGDNLGIEMVASMLEEREKKRIDTVKRNLAKLQVSDPILVEATKKKLKPRKANSIVPDAQLAVRARQAEWNLNYWMNAYRPPFTHPDPFATRHGQSRWGFEHHPEDGPREAAQVCTLTTDDVGDTYARHFIEQARQARFAERSKQVRAE